MSSSVFAQPNREDDQYLAFVVAEERFALPLARVISVLDAGALTGAPDLPAGVLGVVTHADSVVPVLDLCVRLKLSRQAPITGCIALLETGSRLLPVVGIAIDRVEQISTHAGKIEPLPRLARSKAPGLGQVAHFSEGLLLLLDPGRILAGAELQTLATLSEARA